MSGFWIATIGGLVYYDQNMGTYQDIVHPDIFEIRFKNILRQCWRLMVIHTTVWWGYTV